MDQMEAFTEIMLRRFYPAWPDVSPLFLKNSCLTFPEKRVFGELHAHEALLSLNPFTLDLAFFSIWKWNQKNKHGGGVLFLLYFWGSSVIPPQLRPSHPTPSRAEGATAPLAHSLPLPVWARSPKVRSLQNCMRPHWDSYHCLPQNAKLLSLNFLPNPFKKTPLPSLGKQTMPKFPPASPLQPLLEWLISHANKKML